MTGTGTRSILTVFADGDAVTVFFGELIPVLTLEGESALDLLQRLAFHDRLDLLHFDRIFASVIHR